MARFLHRAVICPPISGRLEAAGPHPSSRASGCCLGNLIVTISNRPACFHHHAAKIPAIRLAARQQPSVAVTLPAGAGDRLARNQRHQGGPRFHPASINVAISRAFLRKLRRVDAANPDALIQYRQTVSVGDSCPSRDLPQGNPVQPRRHQRNERENRQRKRQIADAAHAA